MSMLWLAVLTLGVTTGDGSSTPEAADKPAAVAEKPLVAPRQGTELNRAIDAALRRWAKVSDADSPLAAQEFLVLYNELRADRKIARQPTEERVNLVRGRLNKLAAQISRTPAAEKRDARQAASVEAAAAPRVMAQWGGGQGFGAQGFGAQGFAGGFGGQGFAGQGQAKDDNGDDLADLIQKTIAPSSWEINGGLGTISYWRPGRAMVVRQTDGVHEQLTDLIKQLERANQ